MIRRYVEVQCDACGSAEHFNPSVWKTTARGYGWIITSAGQHFCTGKCHQSTVNKAPPTDNAKGK